MNNMVDLLMIIIGILITIGIICIIGIIIIEIKIAKM